MAIALGCGILMQAGCRLPWGQEPPPAPTPVKDKSLPAYACPLDGSPAGMQDISRRPLAVMVENSPDARPQSGLTKACVVYEAITEGGITRFLAVFLHGNPAVIGPVRSARPHFINIEREYDAAYVHCGESYEALQILSLDPSIRNLDQMKYPRPFWRDHTRRAPHNLYTSSAKLRTFLTLSGWGGQPVSLPNFTSSDRLKSGQPAHTIDIHIPGAVHYRLRMVYDKKLGGYQRYMDGKLHVDRETQQPVVAKNVIFQRVYAAPFVSSDKGTFDVEVVGSGEGEFMSGGFQESLLWQKTNIYTITSFTDTHGQSLPFRPGQTWVEVLPADSVVTVIN